ncbi:hypothetical protein JCM10908_006348 [Rhodotorula pacifica]|uniref:uncharacterized protein n=1 Tax=Rhodotorula pacifica TaxID=1495444 RepID=UPI0031827945
MDTTPSTLHDYFPRASGSNLLPVSPRRPSSHFQSPSSTLAPRTEPYTSAFPIPSYLQHASLYRDRFSTGEGAGTGYSVGEANYPTSSAIKGKAKQYDTSSQPHVPAGASAAAASDRPAPILLPTVWNPDDRCALLDLTSDALGVSFAGSAKNGDRDAAAVRANRPVPSQAGVYYFEVKVLDKGVSGYIGIGLCHKSVSLSRLPGWEDKSYGYHADDGRAFCCQGTGEPFGPTFTTGDTVGCGIDWTDAGPARGPRERSGNKARDRAAAAAIAAAAAEGAAGGKDKDKEKSGGRVFFTKNGQFIGYAFCNLQGPLYPTVGLRTPNEAVRANFGAEPFVFDIESLVLERKRTVLSHLSQLPAPSSSSTPSHFLPSPISHLVPSLPALLPPSDREKLHETIQALVASYLSHHGYVKTAESFLGQLREDRGERATGLGPPVKSGGAVASTSSSTLPSTTEEPAASGSSSSSSAVLRAEIRAAALSGTASGAQRALDLIEEHFPALLDSPAPSAPSAIAAGEGAGDEIEFRLRCRVFVEAVLEWSRASRDPAGMDTAANEAGPSTTTTAQKDEDDEDASMLSASVILDNTSTAAASATTTASSSSPPFTLDSILSLGQSLHSTYSSDSRPQIRDELQAVLGLLAYRDPEREATGRTRELLQKGERERLAEEVNKAVLRAAGLPPVPALEALYRQAAASIQLAGDLGSGSAAMVDVKSMFTPSPSSSSSSSSIPPASREAFSMRSGFGMSL